MQRNEMLRASILSLSIILSLSACAAAPQRSAEIPSGDTLQVKRDVRVVYGIRADDVRDGVGEGLFFVERLLDNYDREGVPAAQRQVVVVLYNDAAYWLLNPAAWAAYTGSRKLTGAQNPNRALISRLQERGVRVEVCGTTLKKKGWTSADLEPNIHVVPGAYARLIDLQLQGFASISFD
jgi:uncharacterized protein